jgi:phenylacetyl-CoA:acceptor oxidoreductase 26-kDa subunit
MDGRNKMGTQLISPTKQKQWAWPAAANFTLGGAGTGFYLFIFLAGIFDNSNFVLNDPVPFGPIGLVLVGSGFLCLIIEAGRPLRSHYLLHHLRKAWISKEMLAFVFFVTAVILDYFYPQLLFKACAALSALFLMIAQGFILYASRAVPAWNVSIMPLFFLSSGFASGAALTLLLAALGRLVTGNGLGLLSLTCIFLNMIVWLFYLRWSNAVDFRSATEALRRPFMMFFIIVFGHAFPILMLLLLQIRAFSGTGAKLPGVFAMLSGLAIIIGVTAQKSGIVMSSGYLREINIKL